MTSEQIKQSELEAAKNAVVTALDYFRNTFFPNAQDLSQYKIAIEGIEIPRQANGDQWKITISYKEPINPESSLSILYDSNYKKKKNIFLDKDGIKVILISDAD